MNEMVLSKTDMLNKKKQLEEKYSNLLSQGEQLLQEMKKVREALINIDKELEKTSGI